jgi:membrane associated rhomboid family serine protease
MGFWDRDYSREGPSFLGTVSQRGKVCKWLIVANVICFVLQLVTRRTIEVPEFGVTIREPGPSPFTALFWLDADQVIQHWQIWRLLTQAFLHDPSGISHILWNMLFLWWMGTEVEDIYGHREFLAFYLLAALASGVTYMVTDLMGFRGHPELGASGAIMGLTVLCACHYPMKQIRLFFLLPVPIWLLCVIYVGKDLVDLLNGGNSVVAVAAHLGGAGWGGLYYLWASNGGRLLGLWPDWRSWRRSWNRPKLRVYREEESEAPVAVAAGVEDEQFEAKLDALLEKVKLSGMQSLSDSERGFLDKASARLKEKRRRT